MSAPRTVFWLLLGINGVAISRTTDSTLTQIVALLAFWAAAGVLFLADRFDR